MGRALQQDQSTSMLAEGAFRNLHLDCMMDGVGGTFSSRMLHLDGDGLVIADPAYRHSNVEFTSGEQMTCSGRLGSEIFRFTGTIAGRRWYQLNPTKRVPALLLTDLGEPEIIQRRRYYRVSLAGHEAIDVTCWIMEYTDGSARVCDEFTGSIVDVSGGGAGILTKAGEKTRNLADKQLWARFMLPGENESLIFRVSLRHTEFVASSGMYHLGLEFQEYIDPGQHRKVLEQLVRYVAEQERVGLRRRKDIKDSTDVSTATGRT